MLLVLIALILLAWLAIQTTPVQNWLVHQVTRKLSKSLHTTVSIKHVDFALFNKMLLEGTLVRDQQQDTLLYAGSVKVNITDWFFLKDKVELKYIGLENTSIHLKRTDSVWNYKFLADFFSSPKKSSGEGIDLNLQTIELDNVNLWQTDGWRGEDMALQLGSLQLDADQVSFSQKRMHINTVAINKPVFAIYNYEGRRPDSLRPKADTTTIINDPKHLRWNTGGWDIQIEQLTLNDGLFKSDQQTDRQAYNHFDGAHILFSEINGTFKKLRFEQDSIKANVLLTTKERSGLVVKKLQANMVMQPEAMEFGKLDLQTNRSHLHNFFAMRYASFNDLSDFISKVHMEGHFDDADLSSDDIAYFAPELQSWKKKITLTGTIKGSVENLSAKKLRIEAGHDTYLNGNISLRGLPDIDKTFIDFEATDFKTTYPDAVTLVPALKNITQPRLDRLAYLRFTGNFTGFVKDFVTYGTLQTNLGTLVTDVNMKFRDKGYIAYSGNIKTDAFALGSFVDVEPQIGNISFSGTINGSGVNAATLNAKLDGVIRSLEFNNYKYQDITVKGTVAKRLFNGELTIKDTSLQGHLDGLVDFSKKVPQFNFDATISKANLKKLGLIKDSVDFIGKFRFNFTGDNIDNFLGTARIYDASVLRNGRRISFDSLYLESKEVGNNKVITVLSNEFDAALAGEFSIRELPAAFRTFLNRYYPSYIKPAGKPLLNENFSFVITTKKVDEYLDFIDQRLDGFSYSTIAGRINTKENLLDLNVEVPQFSYGRVAVYNFNLKGTGTLDSLSLNSSIADVYINDSLHFPGTTMHIRSANDLSQVNITTSANQTLNSANIQARLQTMPRGVRIMFDESHFDVNGKNWTIDKDGELVLSEDLIAADGVKLYTGQQEILITTQPSDIGNTNDIKIALKKINIGDFAPYVVPKNRLEGLLNATVDVIDPFGRLQVEMNGDAEQFRLDDDSIGRLQLTGNFDKRTRLINFGALSDNNNYRFNVKGNYKLPDSTTNVDQLDISSEFTETQIALLRQYLSGVFSDLNGYTSGRLQITGPANNLKYLGKLQVRDVSLRVKYTNVLYKVPSATFNFSDDQIDFGSFTIKDEFNNSGIVSKGILKHQNFDNLNFDFAMSTNKLQVLATNNTGAEPFFGHVFAKATATLRGPLDDLKMNIRGEPADSSKLYIRSQSGRQNGNTGQIVWKVYGKEMNATREVGESNLSVSLDVTANNLVDMYVILDELTGDIIQANGHGNLQIHAGTDGEFTITGRYDIDRGNYNFNFQSLLHKPFKLREGVGNYIQWRSDPYDATIKIDAEYRAQNVRFSDLGLDQFSIQSGSSNSNGVNNNVRKYRGEVVVVASLTDKLMSPLIKFQIELPQGSPLKNDQDALAILQRIQNDENELNKQVAFLIVFNSFGPMTTSTNQSGIANIAFEGVVVSSISGVLSNALSKQFSDIFQKIFNDKSIRVNFNAQLYSGSNYIDNVNNNRLNIDRTNLNFNVGKSFLNERLTFTFGSALDFGLSSQQVQATRNLQFLPDLTAEWKIRPDGKVVLAFFYRDSYNYLSGAGARQNRSGASISYRRDFDHLSELWRGREKKKKNTDSTSKKQLYDDTSGTK